MSERCLWCTLEGLCVRRYVAQETYTRTKQRIEAGGFVTQESLNRLEVEANLIPSQSAIAQENNGIVACLAKQNPRRQARCTGFEKSAKMIP